MSLETSASPQDQQVIRERLTAYNVAQGGDDRYQPLDIFVRDQDDEIIGGLIGNTYWGWLAINLLWIHERMRGLGLGSRMVIAAEQEALRRGCHGAHVDTMSFQAPDFYLKMGYEIFGQIDDIPVSYSRYYLKKKLTPTTE
jgi:GNAT superfamily N-acetyltransferase